MPKALVTVATDGFRDYVELPDGRTLNLGSVSVLKLVTSLVSKASECRKALDAFLENGSAVIRADIESLEALLKPKRARWAGKDLMPHETQRKGMSSDLAKLASEDSTNIKFSNSIRAFKLQGAPSESTIAAFKQDSTDFSGYVMAKIAAIDEVAKHELEEFLENDSRALTLKEGVIKSILSKPRYDHNHAKKLWLDWVNKGAESYAKKFDEDDNALFPRPLRESLSREIADKERKLIGEGEYSHLKTAGASMGIAREALDLAKKDWREQVVEKKLASESDGQGETQKEAQEVKLAAEEVPFVNEGLIHLVASKVEQALSVVSNSQKKGSDVARGDLHIISMKLDELTKTASMEDPGIRPVLLDLAKKADYVHSFFA